MIVIFMISAIGFGWFADKQIIDRRYLLAFGIMFWSLTTAVAGLSQNLIQLVIFRSLVGVGEACYGTIAPPMLFDYFPASDRNVTFGVYYLAIPVGAALGYAIGTTIATLFGWRWAFLGLGLPGVIIALSVIHLNNPVRGINDEEVEAVVEIRSSKTNASKTNKTTANPLNATSVHLELNALETDLSVQMSNESLINENTPEKSEVEYNINHQIKYTAFQLAVKETIIILQNKVFILCLLGLAAQNFALGGIADWVTVYMQRYQESTLEEAGLVAGAVTVVGGISGTILGSEVVQYYDGKVKSAYFLIPALFTLPAAFCLMVGLNIGNKYVAYVMFLLFEICVWTNTAPVNALSIQCVDPALRSRAGGLLIFCQHILGDIISPPLIGYFSDSTGSLRTGLQMTWIATLVSGAYWYAGYMFLSALPIMNPKHASSENESHRLEVEGLTDTHSTPVNDMPEIEHNRTKLVHGDSNNQHNSTHQSLTYRDALIGSH